MLIRAGYNISFDCLAPTPMVLALSVHPSVEPQLETPDAMKTSPSVPRRTYIDLFGNRCTRLVAAPGPITFSADFLVRVDGEPDPVVPGARLAAIEDLPDDALIFLLSSRYCEVDRMSDLAWSLFGHLPADWSRVQAIVDYTHDRIAFGYHHARPTKSAYDAHEERQGVCRDYAHLAITLCRCMNIPARYCTGYLGDIGVPPSDSPMDFSGWFEAYVGGAWHTFDARHNKPRIGRIVMARGRDAADVAITTTFANAVLTQFEVITEEIAQDAPRMVASG